MSVGAFGKLLNLKVFSTELDQEILKNFLFR